MKEIRNNWKIDEITSIYHSPLLELIAKANALTFEYHKRNEVQLCQLISIKTGGCPEDCKYCAQSSRYQTNVQAQPLMNLDDVLKIAKEAIERGVSRICLGAAWREVRDNPQFERILEMVKGITAMGAEVCCTLGMLNESQAKKLAEAGLYAYNHNLDSSPDFYKTIITTRTYQDRLNTLDIIEKSNITVCCGGILGMGETIEDRIKLLHVLATRSKHPDSVPINLLYPVEGTPLQDQKPVAIWELIRMIATARIIMPQSVVRLSCGRLMLSLEQQALCFLAGANSIHVGEKLLTVGNPGVDQDKMMLELFGLKPKGR